VRQIFTFISFIITGITVTAQTKTGHIKDAETQEPVIGATVQSTDGRIKTATDKNGKFIVEHTFEDSLVITATGYLPVAHYWAGGNTIIRLTRLNQELEDVVITGTMRPVSKAASPIAVEVYSPQFFKKNPAPSLFESLQNINGVRPQLNCSVCNTGDIHINGLEGPYTMVTIDGMPIVGSLASVYGLFGIPSQLIERVEIVKGPASGLYGAEAIGGLVNIITKSVDKAPLLSANVMTTSWLEHNIDAGLKYALGKKVNAIIGVNYFNYGNKQDNNHDNFTDVTLQHRISVFNKYQFKRKDNRIANLAARYFYEDRWGGEMGWNRKFRGGDSLYGESIYTNRWELLGNYQLPVKEKMFVAFSATSHDQNAYYGTTAYIAKQNIVFGQLTWDKAIGTKNNFLAGIATRYNYYDDNSTATIDTLNGKNKPEQYVIPGVFVQNEWSVNARHLLLTGLRYDYHRTHGSIITPRLAWKWRLDNQQIVRLNAGTGFRVVSVFTEDHAALTGARTVEIINSLKPEKSYNINLNYTNQFKFHKTIIGIDFSSWYSYFTNQIIADYDTDPKKIIYDNLDGHAVSKGISLNMDININHRLKAMIGGTVQQVEKVEEDDNGKKLRTPQILTEKWSGTWLISYSFPGIGLTADYTGNIYGPMRLPLLGETDPRLGYSPVWSIQNIQLTKTLRHNIEVFGGVKNLLNWTPAKKGSFVISRANDPFGNRYQYEQDGVVVNPGKPVNPQNTYGLDFDPSYVYAPMQGIKGFIGIRYVIK
jgi:outer membrane receptor for ferrienterochelin and colicins